jgi:hypothetical protein
VSQGKGGFASPEDEAFNTFKAIFRDIPVLKEIPSAFRFKVSLYSLQYNIS